MSTELSRLRKMAAGKAKARNETVSTVHLLAAVCEVEGPARELLAQRRVDEASVLKASRSFAEEEPDALSAALAAAREIAYRSAMPARGSFPSSRREGARPAALPAPRAEHVLVALLLDRRSAAFRALQYRGLDLPKLRAAVTRVVLGVVAPPRAPRNEAAREARSDRPVAPEMAQQAPRRPARPVRDRAARPRAVEVPLVPPSRPSRDTSEPHSVELPVATPSAPAPVESVPPSQVFDPAALPVLAELGVDLTEAWAEGRLDPVVGRELEIERALDVLAKRHANNALLVGPAGVGKTSVARGLAAALDGGRRLIEIRVNDLLAGTGARGSLAERIAAVRADVERAAGQVVLFIDDIHELLGGAADEALGELRAALAAGSMPLVCATTPEAFARHIEADPGLARRFSLVEVDEPSEKDALSLIESVCGRLAEHHGVTVNAEAMAAAIGWSVRYLPGRALPDKAISILDLAAARVRRRRQTTQVEPKHVAEVVAELCEVPVDRLMQTDHERMLALSELLGERVVGHDEPCRRIGAVLRRNAAGLRGRRPIGTFLLLGPTGVGKTETAKAIAELLFHSPDAMTRLDLSEYAEAHAVARLVGAPPGYVGHEAGGLLTEAVRKRPYQVILLDEIEKAHRDVLEAFLQVFDEGRMTDGRGRTVSFDNTVLILTSNLGASEMRAAHSRRRVGFGAAERSVDHDELGAVALDAAKAELPPELYNRIDEVLFFAPLGRREIAGIARRLLGDLATSLRERGVELDVDDAVLEVLMERGGYDPELGARPMRRTIARLIEAPLADMILRGELQDQSVVLVGVEDGHIVLDVVDAQHKATA